MAARERENHAAAPVESEVGQEVGAVLQITSKSSLNSSTFLEKITILPDHIIQVHLTFSWVFEGLEALTLMSRGSWGTL